MLLLLYRVYRVAALCEWLVVYYNDSSMKGACMDLGKLVIRFKSQVFDFSRDQYLAVDTQEGRSLMTLLFRNLGAASAYIIESQHPKALNRTDRIAFRLQLLDIAYEVAAIAKSTRNYLMGMVTGGCDAKRE